MSGGGRGAAGNERRSTCNYARIVAPFDGVVTHRTFHVGALIRSAMGGGQQPLLTVKRTDLMRVVVLVPDRDVVLTKVGDTAVVSVDALDGRRSRAPWRGSPRPRTPSGSCASRSTCRTPTPPLRRHVRQGRRSPSGKMPKTLAVPAACVVEHGPIRRVVYLVRDGVARRTEVKLGGDNGTQVEILSGSGPATPSCSPPGRRSRTGCGSPRGKVHR